MYENRHYECILRTKDEEIVKLREDLLAARHKSKLDPQIIADREDQLKAEIYLQKQKIEAAVENENSGKKHAELLKEKLLKCQEQLTEAHRLVKVHLHTAADYRDESKKVQADKEECERKIDETENKLRDVQKQLKDLQIKHADDVEAAESKTEEFENKVIYLTSEIERQARIIDDGDIQLKQKNQLTDELTEELNQAKAILNIEKENEECQTILQMLDTCDSGVQIESDKRNKESQTTCLVQSQSSQTIDPAVKNSGIQTIVVKVSEDEVQTEAGDLQDNSTQTARQGTHTKTSQTDCVLIYKEVAVPVGDGLISLQDKHEPNRVVENTATPGIFQALHASTADKMAKQYKNSLNKSEMISQLKDNRISGGHVEYQQVEQERDQILIDDFGNGVAINEEDQVPDMFDGQSTVSANVNKNNPEIGISVPKLNLHKDFLVTDQVVIDPDEFNVSLTQDEIVTDVANEQLVSHASYAVIPTNAKEFEFRGSPGDHFIETPSTSSETRNSGQHNRRIKRSQEKELTSTDVENYFNEFEERGRNFKGVTKRPASPNESRAKHIKVSESNQHFTSFEDTSKCSVTATSDEILTTGIDTMKKKLPYSAKSVDRLDTCEVNTNDHTTELRFGSNGLSNETKTTTCTQGWMKSTMSSHGPSREITRVNTQPPTMTAFDIMQRYKDTVAKIRPMQGQIRPGKQPVCTTPSAGSSNLAVTSPRVGTVRGILKGSKEDNQGKGCKVSWNEMTEFKIINN